MKYKIRPFPAVRVNGKNGRFTDKAKNYHSQMNYLRLLIGSDKETIINLILSGVYELQFIFAIPNSLSKKNKALRLNNPHIAKPDLDNLFKAFTDTIFYGTDYNDSGVFKLNASKYRGEEDLIIIN